MSSLLLVGGGDSTVTYPKENIEIWGQNNVFMIHSLPYTRWFEIHEITPMHRKGSPSFRGMSIKDYIKAIDDLNIPVYCRPDAPFKNKTALPDLSEFRQFFDTTISYMIAFAIKNGYKDIFLKGIDMCTSEEHIKQKASVTYFLGLAEGNGIHIHTGKDSPILESEALYPETGKRFLWDQRINALRQHMETESTKHNNLLQQYIGAKNCLENVKDFYTLLQKE